MSFLSGAFSDKLFTNVETRGCVSVGVLISSSADIECFTFTATRIKSHYFPHSGISCGSEPSQCSGGPATAYGQLETFLYRNQSYLAEPC